MILELEHLYCEAMIQLLYMMSFFKWLGFKFGRAPVMAEPASKRVKRTEADVDAFEELSTLQEKIEDSFDEETAKILELKQEFSDKRASLISDRTLLIDKIPGFWLQVVR